MKEKEKEIKDRERERERDGSFALKQVAIVCVFLSSFAWILNSGITSNCTHSKQYWEKTDRKLSSKRRKKSAVATRKTANIKYSNWKIAFYILHFASNISFNGARDSFFHRPTRFLFHFILNNCFSGKLKESFATKNTHTVCNSLTLARLNNKYSGKVLNAEVNGLCENKKEKNRK